MQIIQITSTDFRTKGNKKSLNKIIIIQKRKGGFIIRIFPGFRGKVRILREILK